MQISLCTRNQLVIHTGCRIVTMKPSCCVFHGMNSRPCCQGGSENSLLQLSSEVVVKPGTSLELKCGGDGPVNWQTRLPKHKRYMSRSPGNLRTIRVARPTAEFTGTYKCFYSAWAQHRHLTSSVHVYIKDPNRVFWTSSTSLRVVRKEGEDYLLPCLLTDPEATDLGLRMDNGTTVPPEMNYTVYRHRGILIRSLQPSFNADYVCTAKVKGVEKTSKTFSINVIQKLRFPPYVFLEMDEYVRIVGEELQIRCMTHNPNFNYNVTWNYTTKSRVTIEERVRSSGENRLDIQSILTISAVDLADTGNISCIGTNEAGVNSSNTYLLVVVIKTLSGNISSPTEKPYIRLWPQLIPKLASQGLSVEVNEGEDLELGVMVEAYPQITDHRWHTPTSPSTSMAFEDWLQMQRDVIERSAFFCFPAVKTVFLLLLTEKPIAVVRWENITTLTCTSFGYPAPQIIWYQCSGIRPTCNGNNTGLPKQNHPQALTVEVQREEYGAVEVESVFTVGLSNHRMTVECVAFNLVGVSSDTFTVELFTSTLIGAAGVLAIFLLLLVFLLYKYKQKPRFEIRWKIIEAREGNNYTFIDPTQLPYNEKWEFPRDKLKLGKVLGAGAFGKVVEATAFGLGEDKDNTLRVAVKMLKANAHSDEREALMSELKILSHLGHHQNIVNLLGACTYGGQPASPLGSVIRGAQNQSASLHEKSSSRASLFSKESANKESFILRTKSLCEDNGDWPLDIDDLLRFSLQVAQGLDFLASRNCIHRDVAARNVLLTDKRVAKICDFGLARDIMNDSNYVVKGNARLPVKWMAPESIFDCVYTVQSDVWSYGILLWEIFSLGKSPYPSMAVDSRFYKMVKRGYQMSQPDFALPEIYMIMKMCWNLEPTERPTFSMISQMINRLLGGQDEQEKLIYRNVQPEQVAEGEACDEPKRYDPPCERSCDHEEEEEPLMKTNNYQFC
uniref:receptor protein-tyrosine kinase n=1 Tax=Takifugu rubripes TaxID=31033 RepID=A0A674PMF5_TAKRU